MTDCSCTNFPASLGNVTFEASVGIGTTTPAGALDVAGSGAPVAAFVGPTSDDYGALILRGGSAGTYWELVKLRSSDVTPNGFSLQAVNGSNTVPVLVASPTGQIGIGAITPAHPLDVGGDIHTSGALRADGAVYAVAAPGQGDALFIGNDAKLSDINIANTTGLFGQQDSTVGSLQLGSAGGTLTGANGHIGIGTTTPLQALDVNGTVRTTGILLGGDQLMYGALKDSTGTRTNVDAGGCYYAS